MGDSRPRTPAELQYSDRKLRSRSRAKSRAESPKPSRSSASAIQFRPQDWAEGAALNYRDRSRGGDNRRVQAAYLVSAGRMSLYDATDDPASDAFSFASLP